MTSFTCYSFMLTKLVKKRKPNYPEECLNMITVHGVPEVIQLKGVFNYQYNRTRNFDNENDIGLVKFLYVAILGKTT